MPLDLLDVNVWLALVDPDHAHHERARKYWEEESYPKVAFCRVSMLGLMRLATNTTIMRGSPFTPEEIWQAYRRFRALPEICLIEEPAGLESWMANLSDRPAFPASRWTDCYLAAFSLAASCRMVSFDGVYREFAGLEFLHLVS